MKRRSYESSAAFLVVFAAACQSGLPTELIVDDSPASVPDARVPPLAGGTLLVTADAATAVVSDPDRDRVSIASLTHDDVRAVALEPGDEPGRLAEGPPGVVFVALRRGGAVVAVDLDAASVAQRAAVCEAPRGILYDGSSASLLVACASGELVTLDASTLEETRRLHVGPDLRDVIKRGDDIFVTHFRSASLTRIDLDGAPLLRVQPPDGLSEAADLWREPNVAWRTVVAGDAIVMVHQMARVTEIDLSPPTDEDGAGDGMEGSSSESYGGECDEQPVHAELTVFRDDTLVAAPAGPATMGGLHLPVDVAVSPDGSRAVVVDPGAHRAKEIDLNGWLGGDCFGTDESSALEEMRGTPVAVAYAGDAVVVQTREPAELHMFRNRVIDRTIVLGGESRADTGFDLFHNTSELSNQTGMACASCHPEGRDDGHVWVFSGEGERRTQSLAGTLAGTAPFHWGGNLPTLRSLMDEVSTRRMGGVKQSPARVAALESWLLGLEPLRVAPDPVVDQELIDQGQALFEDETVGCASCHSGPSFTNNRNESVGRGAALQVPSLIGIGMRAPFMHDGCAETLMKRFAPACGGDQHGDIDGLDDDQRAALVAYMNTL